MDNSSIPDPSAKEKHAACCARWQRNNPDKVAAKSARWYAKAKATGGEAFLEKQREKGRIQRAKHGAKYLAQHKQWLKEHPEVKLAGQRKRRARKANAPVNDFTAKQWRALCKAAGYRCAYCQQKFAFKDLTQDHITPLSKGGSHTLSNIIPACGRCNSRKLDGAVLRPVQPFLLIDEGAAD